MVEFASADAALAAAIRLAPTQVLVVVELPNGSLQLLSGPDMTLERINWTLDKAKLGVLTAQAATTNNVVSASDFRPKVEVIDNFAQDSRRAAE